ARAVVFRPPGRRLGELHDADPRVVHVRRGHTSGRRDHGRARAQRGLTHTGPRMSDAIVIGAGVNGLVTAALLAKSGRKVVVLEAGDRVGGCARTSELAPGFRCPTLSHVAALDPSLVRSLALEPHGLTVLRPPVDAFAPARDGRALVLWSDRPRAADEIRAFSSKDADRYSPFLDSFAKIAGVLRGL